MKRKLLFLFLFILTISIISCKKEDLKQNDSIKKDAIQDDSTKNSVQLQKTKQTNTSDWNSAYDFTLMNLRTNKDFTLSSFAGKVIIVDFWATWCPPCRASVPVFNALHNKYNSKGLEIVGISLDRNGPQEVLTFMNDKAIQYNIVMGNEEVVSLYGGISGIPTAFILDRKGNLIKKHVGFMSQAMLEKEIEGLL